MVTKNLVTCNCRQFVKQQLPYLNRHPIEDYIDRFFLINVPDTLSIAENHSQVYRLLHILFVKEYELTQMEDEEAHPNIFVGKDNKSESAGPTIRSPMAFSFQPHSKFDIEKGGISIKDEEHSAAA